MPVVPKFRYLGVVFEDKLIWSAHGVHYIQQKCRKRIEFFAIYGKVVLGSRTGCDVEDVDFVQRGLIRSVLEYGCIAFNRMASMHMLKLD
jgi:hypothetical protein